MECTFGQPLSDEQLAAALDDVADREVRQHLASCPACAARLAQAAQTEETLSNQLYRFDCVGPQQLGEYHLGLLSSIEQRTILRHLEQCLLCTQELTDLREFMVEDSVQPPVPQRTIAPLRRTSFRDLVVQLLPPSPEVALRGTVGGMVMREVGDTTFIVDIQKATSGKIGLIGQVVADDAEQWNGALVEISQGLLVQGFATVDDLGGWNYAPVSPGAVEVRLTREAHYSVVLQGISIPGDDGPRE